MLVTSGKAYLGRKQLQKLSRKVRLVQHDTDQVRWTGSSHILDKPWYNWIDLTQFHPPDNAFNLHARKRTHAHVYLVFLVCFYFGWVGAMSRGKRGILKQFFLKKHTWTKPVSLTLKYFTVLKTKWHVLGLNPWGHVLNGSSGDWRLFAHCVWGKNCDSHTDIASVRTYVFVAKFLSVCLTYLFHRFVSAFDALKQRVLRPLASAHLIASQLVN